MASRLQVRAVPLDHGTQTSSAPLHGDVDEQTLVARVRAGDVSAFTRLVEQHANELSRFAESYLHAPDRAEEVVQDVFASLWDLRARWTVSRGIRSYLFGAVRNRALSARRRMRLEAHSILSMRRPSQHATGMAGDTAAYAEVSELAATIRAVVDRLPDRCREVFRLARDHELPYAEIATIMGISIKTVDAQVAKAVRAVREALARRD